MRLLLLAALCVGCVHFPSYRELVTARPGTRILVRDASVFTGTDGALLPHHDVYVQDGLIVSVKPTGETPPSADVVIEGAGKTLLPGLVDVHVHTSFGSLPPWYLAVPDP